MATTTTNYGLVKPAATDRVDIGVIDGDLDVIDSQLLARDSKSFNVKSYGATGDGAANDAPSVQSAINAAAAAGGGVVFFPAGTYLWSTTTPYIPKDTPISIVGSGRKHTTIKLSSAGPRAFDFHRTADHDTFRDVSLHDFTVDCDNVTGAGSTHVIIGNKPYGGTSNRQNFQDISVCRITAINVPTDYTNTFMRFGVGISPCQTAPGESTQNYAKRILIEDVDVFGGNAGVNVFGGQFGGDTAGYNMYLDDIKILRCRHVQPAIVGRGNPSSDDTTVWGASFHVGQNANVGRVLIRDCYSYGIGDVAFEINNARDALIENCHAEEASGYPFYHTNYEYPDQAAAIAGTPAAAATPGQRVVFRNCSYTRRASYAYGSAFRTNYNHSVPLGRVVLENCKYYRNFSTETTWKVLQGEAVGIFGSMAEATISNFQCVVENINHTHADDAQTVSFMHFAPVSIDTYDVPVTIRDCTFDLAGTLTGGGRIQMFAMSFTGAGPIQMTVDGVSYKNMVTGLLSADAHGIDITTGGTHVTGSISRFRTVRDGTANGHAIEIGTSANVAISSAIVLSDSDTRNRNGGAGAAIGSTNLSKVIVSPTFLDGVSTSVASATTTTLPRSGEFFTITGAEGITSITAAGVGRKVVLFFSSTASLTDGSNLILSGDFTGAANRSISLICDGTNWIEASRSSN